MNGLRLPADMDPVAWIEKTISMTADPTAAVSGRVKLDAWQIEPIKAQFRKSTRMMVLIAPEQSGKSTCWRLPLAYKMLYNPAPRWVIYESQEKAEQINRRTLDPVLRSIPELARMMSRATATKQTYALPNGSITDFSGAGADITSKPIQDGVADELDRWGTYDFATQNLRNFIKRFRTFWRHDRGCLAVCCSPKTEGGNKSPVFELFERETNCGYWHLRCLGCGNLTMRSCDIHNLQWEMNGSTVIPESIRLICSRCGHEHVESDALTVSESGGYVLSSPEVTGKEGYQVGTLGVPRVFRWTAIAEAQTRAGSTADVSAQIDFDNSWRALPWKRRKTSEKRETVLKKHCITGLDDICFVLMSCDTQDDCVFWVVRGMDQKMNSILLGYGKAMNLEELAAAWDATYAGMQCVCGIIDAGGHRTVEINDFVSARQGFFTYKGNSKIGVRWRISESDQKLILANPLIYRGELLYYMYLEKPTDNNYWGLPEDVGEEYLEQLLDVRPNNKIKGGNDYSKWDGTGNDHYFDCEKMWFVIKDFALTVLKKTTRRKETRKCKQ